jgi:CheY-like chemotaxis protein
MDVQPDTDHTGHTPSSTAVLVVEDDAFLRSSIASFLERRGFAVSTAGCASDAIRILMKQAPIEVVFTDVRMPGTLNGLDLARWVRDERPGITVIVTSADPQTTDVAARLVGTRSVVPKPYDPEIIETRIREGRPQP